MWERWSKKWLDRCKEGGQHLRKLSARNLNEVGWCEKFDQCVARTEKISWQEKGNGWLKMVFADMAHWTLWNPKHSFLYLSLSVSLSLSVVLSLCLSFLLYFHLIFMFIFILIYDVTGYCLCFSLFLPLSLCFSPFPYQSNKHTYTHTHMHKYIHTAMYTYFIKPMHTHVTLT